MNQSEEQPAPKYGDYRDRLYRHRWAGWPLITTSKTTASVVISSPGVERKT